MEGFFSGMIYFSYSFIMAMFIFLFTGKLVLFDFEDLSSSAYRKVAYDVTHLAPKKVADQKL